jgi:streptogramin lyase
MISAMRIVLKSNARSLLWGLACFALCASAAGCSLFGASHSAAVPPPPPVHRGVQQLKTPAQPPVPVALATMYPMPEAFDSNEYLPGIRMGPDQNIWVSVYNSNQMARFNSQGLVSAWSFPPDPQCLNGPPVCSAGPTDMVLGPDGNMYVSLAQSNAIAQVTPIGAVTVYPLDPNVFPILPQGEGPRGIAIGPDGNIWFRHSNTSKIGRMTLSGDMINVYSPPTANADGGRITAGPDGNMWFTETLGNNIGRLNIATGRITEFPTPTAGSYPHTIVTAADGNLWFTEKNANQLGRITTSGVITEFSTPSQITAPTYVYSGPDGSLWFAEKFNSALCRVDPVHETFVEYTTYPDVLIEPDGVTTGMNGDVWVTDIVNDTVDAFTPGGGPPQRPLSRVRHRFTMTMSRSRT